MKIDGVSIRRLRAFVHRLEQGDDNAGEHGCDVSRGEALLPVEAGVAMTSDPNDGRVYYNQPDADGNQGYPAPECHSALKDGAGKDRRRDDFGRESDLKRRGIQVRGSDI